MSSNVVSFRPKEPIPATDDDLMARSAAGDRLAFETLVRRYARRLLGYCIKQTASPHAGEEMAQEVWLAVWDHRATYRPEGRFVVWLFTLAKNRGRNARRAELRRAPVSDLDAETPDASPDHLERLLVGEEHARVSRALLGVSENLREAIVLRFTGELPYDAIARVLETNESTARSRVFHGLKELRRRLKACP